MVTKDGHVYVLDFGIARSVNATVPLTQKGVLLGTPAYMSPEQARVEGLDFRTDVYSLGATLYAALTRRPPFEGSTALEIVQRVDGAVFVAVAGGQQDVQRERAANHGGQPHKRTRGRRQVREAAGDDAVHPWRKGRRVVGHRRVAEKGGLGPRFRQVSDAGAHDFDHEQRNPFRLVIHAPRRVDVQLAPHHLRGELCGFRGVQRLERNLPHLRHALQMQQEAAQRVVRR